MFRLTCFYIFSLIFIEQALAQREVKDSLTTLLNSGIKGEQRVDVLNDLAYQYFDFNDSLAAGYANQALTEANKLHYNKGLKYAYTMVGLGYASKSMYRWAIMNYRKSDGIKVEGTDGISTYNLTLLGNTYRDQAMFDSAQIIYRLAIKNFGDSEKHHLATLYKNFAILHIRLWRNQEGLQYLDSANVIFEEFPDAYSQLDIWATYGQVYQNLMQFDKSREYYSKMCSAAQNLEDYFHQIKCLIRSSHLDYRTGNLPQALLKGLEALSLIELYSYPPQHVEALIQVAMVYTRLSQFELANNYLFQALKIAEQNNLVLERADIYYSIAWLHKDQGNYELGLDYANQSQTIFEKVGSYYGAAGCHNVRGLIFFLQKKYRESIQEHEKARQMRIQIHHTEGVAASIFNMSLVYAELKDYQNAFRLLKESIALEEGIDNIYSTSISYNQLAMLLIATGRLDEAEQYLKQSRTLALQTGSKLLLRNNAGFFADLYETKQDYKKALEYKKLYQMLNDSIYSETSASKMAEMQALYQVEKKNQEIKLLNNEKELHETQLQAQKSRLQFQRAVIAAAVIGIISLSLGAFMTYRYAKRVRNLNREISEQYEEIQAQAEELTESNQALSTLNNKIIENNEEIQAQSEELTEANQTISQINRSLEDKVEARTAELKQAYKELDTFFYRSSHDFRRPLTTFMGLAEVAKITIKDPNALELFEKVNDTAHNLDKMLVKLQSISDVGGQELVYKEVFLKEIFDIVCDAFRNQLQRKNIRTICEIELKEAFKSYPALLHIIIENLVENSIFFCGASDPFIRLKAYSSGGEVILEVQDNGEGIPEEYQDRMFEMYFRANERSKGNGLGLYIVKKAVDKLGGEISVQSELYKGTSFKIRFSDKHLS